MKSVKVISYQFTNRLTLFEISEILIDISERMISGVAATLLVNQIKSIFHRKKKEIRPVFDLEKDYMLTNICRLYEIPELDIANPTMDRKLIDVLYTISIELLLKYQVEPDHRMQYIAGNYSINTSDRIILISALNEERNNPNRHDSRYQMAFRSIYVLISDNIANVEKEELRQILTKLKPFFDSFSHKELLNHYVA